MPYYDKFQDHGDKKQREQRAQGRGGYDDEGAHYRGQKGGARVGVESGFRFSRGKPQTVSERGEGTTPRPYGEQRREQSDRPAGNRSYGDRPAGGRPIGNRSYGDHPAGNRPYGDRATGRPTGGHTYTRTDGARPVGGHPMGDRPTGDRPTGDRPYGRPAPRDISHTRGGDPARSQGRFVPGKFAPKGPRPAVPVSREDGYSAYRYDAPATYSAPQQDEQRDDVPPENLLCGRNPIREALKSGRDIEKLMVQRGELSGSAREIVQMAKDQHVVVQEVDRARLDAIAPNHQGMLAFASAYQYHTVDEMLALAKERGEAPLLVILDGVTDPHNLGAVIRSAECAGAHGVIVQERRAVGLTPAAVKASAGAIEHMMVARVTNLTRTIEELQKQSVWVFAADMDGEDYRKADLSGALALVVGAEGEGVGRLVLEKCDKTISIPLKGQIDSLNASVAAGILLFAAAGAR